MRAIKRGQREAKDETEQRSCSRCCAALVKCIRRRSSAPKPIPEPMETVVLEKRLGRKAVPKAGMVYLMVTSTWITVVSRWPYELERWLG